MTNSLISSVSRTLGFLGLCLGLGLAACSQQPINLQPQSNSQPVDFSGHWEMNYAQSDDIRAEVNGLVREVRKQAQRRAAVADVGGALVNVGGGGGMGESVIALAQMADMITQSALMTITQDDEAIKVEREGDFALDCQFVGDQAYATDSPLGRERCGWDGHQLVFTLFLPDGLSIRQRMTLSPDREQLNVATTVVSSQVSQPFTLNRVYNRYDPAEAGFHCKMTLTRGRVCTTEAQ